MRPGWVARVGHALKRDLMEAMRSALAAVWVSAVGCAIRGAEQGAPQHAAGISTCRRSAKGGLL